MTRVSQVGYFTILPKAPGPLVWTPQTGPDNGGFGWEGICWSEERQIFVVVGRDVTGQGAMTSQDGKNWTLHPTPFGISWADVCWSKELELFVAVGDGSTGHGVMISADGASWFLQSTPKSSPVDPSVRWLGVAWSPALNLFVAVGGFGSSPTSGSIMTSPDGKNWIGRVDPTDLELGDVAWSPALAEFVAVAFRGPGSPWLVRDTPLPGFWTDVCYSPQLNRVVAVNDNADVSHPGDHVKQVMSSDNGGATWTIRTTPDDPQIGSVCWSPDLHLFAAVGRSNTGHGDVVTSSDGITWARATGAPVTGFSQFTSIVWAPPPKSLFVAVGTDGGGNQATLTSSDGVNWTFHSGLTLFSASNFCDVAYSPIAGLFAMTGNVAADHAVATSPDGVNWTLRTTPFDAFQDWTGICYSSDLGILLAVSDDNGGRDAMTSSDGINWTAFNTGICTFFDVDWSSTLGMFMTVNPFGVPAGYSTDGQNWTAVSQPNGGSFWNAVCAGPNDFVAVGGDNSNVKSAMTLTTPVVGWALSSLDGINWTPRQIPVDSGQGWDFVVWAPSLGIFCAISGNQTGFDAALSSDGINWIAYPTPNNDPNELWWGVAWADELGYFVCLSLSFSGDAQGHGFSMKSTSGQAWVDQSDVPPAIWARIAWSPTLRIFCAVAESSPNGMSKTVMTGKFL